MMKNIYIYIYFFFQKKILNFFFFFNNNKIDIKNWSKIKKKSKTKMYKKKIWKFLISMERERGIWNDESDLLAMKKKKNFFRLYYDRYI